MRGNKLVVPVAQGEQSALAFSQEEQGGQDAYLPRPAWTLNGGGHGHAGSEICVGWCRALTRKNPQRVFRWGFRLVGLVAGTGFEPVTFRL